ncbi:predicted protein, partial [Postia placenta Mad-698-R]
GVGRTRLGPDHRLFVITFHHQMHCLLQIQLSLTMPVESTTPPHIQHCLNYLRQTFLCAGLDSLEEGDFMERDFERDRQGGDMVCNDWTQVYGALDENYEQWLSWSSTYN